MTSNVTGNGSDWNIALDYHDEQVDLAVSKHFSGSEQAANAYVPILDADTRERYAHMFPLPEVESTEEVML